MELAVAFGKALLTSYGHDVIESVFKPTPVPGRVDYFLFSFMITKRAVFIGATAGLVLYAPYKCYSCGTSEKLSSCLRHAAQGAQYGALCGMVVGPLLLLQTLAVADTEDIAATVAANNGDLIGLVSDVVAYAAAAYAWAVLDQRADPSKRISRSNAVFFGLAVGSFMRLIVDELRYGLVNLSSHR